MKRKITVLRVGYLRGKHVTFMVKGYIKYIGKRRVLVQEGLTKNVFIKK